MKLKRLMKLAGLLTESKLSEATTIKSKFNPALSIKVGDDSCTLVTPYGNITFEVAGQYDDFSTAAGVSMDYSAPKGGVTQSEWKNAADAIMDFVSNEDDYLEALKKLLDPKVLGKYIPKIVGKPMSSGVKGSTMQKKPASAPSQSQWDMEMEKDTLLKKIPARYRSKQFRYAGTILSKKLGGSSNLSGRGVYYPLTDILDDIYEAFNENDAESIKYAKSLYMKPGNTKEIFTNFRGKEELELVYMY